MRINKPLLVTLCVVLVIATAVVGTLAFLTDREEVVNTFTVGNVLIDLTETDVDTAGDPIPNAPRVQANEYHLLPGLDYTKDPQITVKAESEESYVRMMVTIEDMDKLLAIMGQDFLPETVVEGWDPAIWSCVGYTDDGQGNRTYEFRYHTTVSTMGTGDQVLEALFQSFTVPQEINGEELATLKDVRIVVQGHAIQAQPFADADAAWAAFMTQYTGQQP